MLRFAIENIPSIKKKGEFMFKWIDSINSLDRIETPEQKRQFLMNLICFASCVEGLFFFAAFAYVYFLRSKGLLNGLVLGQANKVVAIELGISPRTVEVYRANVMAKMHATSLSELVRMVLLAERQA